MVLPSPHEYGERDDGGTTQDNQHRCGAYARRMPYGQQGHPHHHCDSKGEHDQTSGTPCVWVVPPNLSKEPRLASEGLRRSIGHPPDIECEHRPSEGVDQQEDDQCSGRIHVRR